MAWFGSSPTPAAPTDPLKKKYQGPLAPAPLLPLAADTTLAASAAAVAGSAAATKAKKKAAAGGAPLVTAPAAGVKPAVLPPVSLLGY
jgi:hypothetical protein